jgi:peptide/nickel transport system permease protein
MRLTDALLAIPPLLFAIAALVALSPSTGSIILVLTILILPGAARIVRGSVLSLKQRDYVLAARSIGGTGPRIMVFHVLPNALAPLVVYSSLGIANTLLLSAGISFLGLGPQPPAVDWGSMIAEGHTFLRTAPHMVYVPGLAIFLATMIVNLIGDALQDALDPKREGILL